MSDVDRPNGNGDGPEFDAIPKPVFDAIAALERAAATHDREEIAAAVRALADHYGVDAELPVAVDPFEITADDIHNYVKPGIDAAHDVTRTRVQAGSLEVGGCDGADLPAELRARLNHGTVELCAETTGEDNRPYAVTVLELDPDATRSAAAMLLEAAAEAEQIRALEAADD